MTKTSLTIHEEIEQLTQKVEASTQELKQAKEDLRHIQNTVADAVSNESILVVEDPRFASKMGFESLVVENPIRTQYPLVTNVAINEYARRTVERYEGKIKDYGTSGVDELVAVGCDKVSVYIVLTEDEKVSDVFNYFEEKGLKFFGLIHKK